MSIEINYTNKSSGKSSSNLVLFSNDKFSLNGLKNYLTETESSYIGDLLKTSDLKKIYLFLN